jgi:hypothetical protein
MLPAIMKKQAVLAALVCLLTVSARADDDCYTQVIVKNKTGMTLKLAHVRLEWGKWDVGPPIDVTKDREFLYKASGRTPSPSGTEGVLHYSLMSDDGAETGMVYVHEWDLTYAGKLKDKTYANHHGFKVTENSGSCKDTPNLRARCWGCQTILTLTR